MGCTAEQVINEALSLPPLDRAALIERLFQSFDTATDQQTAAKWAQEADSRIQGYDAGLISASPAEDVLARINAR